MHLRITIDTLELAASTDAVSELRVNGQLLVEVQQGLRAPIARGVPRGNSLDTVSFRVVRLHASLGEAQQHLVRRYIELRTLAGKTSAAQFHWDNAAGIFAPWLHSASLAQSPEGTHTGVTTFFSYTLQGNWSLNAPLKTSLNSSSVIPNS